MSLVWDLEVEMQTIIMNPRNAVFFIANNFNVNNGLKYYALSIKYILKAVQ